MRNTSYIVVALLFATVHASAAERVAPQYRFTVVATIPGPAPESDSYDNHFEPGALNSRSDATFAVSLLNTGGQGVFAYNKNLIVQIFRSGQPAPGGGTFGYDGTLSNNVMNDSGTGAVAFFVGPFTYPIGVNVGLYRFSVTGGSTEAVLVPGVTPVPNGGTFEGAAGFGISINNRGDVAFGGMYPTSAGIHVLPETYVGSGIGVFRADKQNRITSVVVPGDAAPGGAVFDYARTPWVNDAGDIAFVGHLQSQPCTGGPQAIFIGCNEVNVYLMRAATGEIVTVARVGEPAPGGGAYNAMFSPMVNNAGEVAFFSSDLTPPSGMLLNSSVFLYRGGRTVAVVRPGDAMPGGGHLLGAGPIINGYHLNERGDITFDAILDTDENGDGIADTGVYVWSNGALNLVARSGTVVPGIGTIGSLQPPAAYGAPFSYAQPTNNARGEILFQATLSDGRTGVLLKASPNP